MDCGAAASLQVSGAFTISFWMAPGTLAGDAPLVALAWPGWNGNNLDLIFNLSLRGNALRFDYGWTDGGLLYSLWWQYGGYVQAGEVGQWTHVALTYAGDRMTMYKNGAIIADWPTGHFPLKNYGGVFHIGHWPQNAEYGGVFNGRLDEVRFAHTARSAGWIRACWLSQKPDSTFITYGRALYVVPQTGGVLIVR